MSRDKQIEMHELAKQMSEAISTAVEQRYIEDEAKLEAVLRANGWRKASDVAEEIYNELDRYSYPSAFGGWAISMDSVSYVLKKYLGKDLNVPTKESELPK